MNIFGILTEKQIREMPRFESFSYEQMDYFRSKANQLLDEGTGEAMPTILYAISFSQMLSEFKKFIASGLYDLYKNDRTNMPIEERQYANTFLLSTGDMLDLINLYGEAIGVAELTTEDLIRLARKEAEQ